MNIVEALTLAKEQGKRVRPKCWRTLARRNCWVVHEAGRFRLDTFTVCDLFGPAHTAEFKLAEELLGEWEVLE